MKILKVIHGYPPTYNAGSEVYSQSICNELSKEHQIHVFTREQDEYRLDFDIREDIRNGITLSLINLPREKDGYEHPQVNEAFTRLLETYKPDIVHIGHLNHLSLGIIREIKKKNIPIVFTLHDFWLMCPRGQFLQRNFDGENLYRLCDGQEHKKCANNCYKMIHSCNPKDKATDESYWVDWVERRMGAVMEIIPMIDMFIAPSKYLMNRFITDFKLPKDKIHYLDYGFPIHYLKPVNNHIKRPFTFGYIGTHIPAKGVNLLIDAFKKVKGKSVLKIWGRHISQNTDSLKRLALGCDNPIIFKNEYANKKIVDEVFNHVDAIVTPSIWGENSPLVIHESQACKIPVITADFGGMKEYVQHKKNGLLFKHRNSESLAEQMQWAIDHPTEMKHLGQRAYLFSNKGNVPDISSHCNELQHIYKQLLSHYYETS